MILSEGSLVKLLSSLCSRSGPEVSAHNNQHNGAKQGKQGQPCWVLGGLLPNHIPDCVPPAVAGC